MAVGLYCDKGSTLPPYTSLTFVISKAYITAASLKSLNVYLKMVEIWPRIISASKLEPLNRLLSSHVRVSGRSKTLSDVQYLTSKLHF